MEPTRFMILPHHLLTGPLSDLIDPIGVDIRLSHLLLESLTVATRSVLLD